MTAKSTALLRSHLLEPLAESPATFRGKRSKFLARLAQRTAFLRRQPSETLEAFPDAFALVWRELAPPLQPLLRMLSLLGAHARPALGAPPQSILSLRRQLAPSPLERLEDAAFLRAELLPRDGLGSRLGPDQGGAERQQDRPRDTPSRDTSH